MGKAEEEIPVDHKENSCKEPDLNDESSKLPIPPSKGTSSPNLAETNVIPSAQIEEKSTKDHDSAKDPRSTENTSNKNALEKVADTPEESKDIDNSQKIPENDSEVEEGEYIDTDEDDVNVEESLSQAPPVTAGNSATVVNPDKSPGNRPSRVHPEAKEEKERKDKKRKERKESSKNRKGKGKRRKEKTVEERIAKE